MRWTVRGPSGPKLADGAVFAAMVLCTDTTSDPDAAWNGSGIITNLRDDPLHCIATMDLDYFRIEYE